MMSASVFFLILAGPIASLFFEGILGVALFFLSQVLIVLFGYLFVSGAITLTINANAYIIAMSSWTTLFFGTLISGGVLAVGIYIINRYLMKAVKSARFHTQELEKHKESLEQVVAERTHELMQSNEELERFAQVAAHDMKSPMSMISGRAQLLEMSCKDILDEKSKSHLNEIVSGTMRLSNMLNDLLMYSRVSSHADEFKGVDMNMVLEIAKKNLSTEIAEYSVVVQNDTLPDVLCDEHQMIRVFQNLIGNAIRYRDKQRPLEVKVSVSRKESEWVFSVSDNGVGIEKEQFADIFEIYHKAENNYHPESSGIGLAACQKIINRHNGRIWVESEVGEGSTFFFSLPYR